MNRWRWGKVTAPAAGATPDWVAANPLRIAQRLAQVQQRSCGGWYVLDGSRSISRTPRSFEVLGRELIAWRTKDGELIVAPEACPHMGASLAGACVRNEEIICPWHGLALGSKGHGRWRQLPCFDDGVLCWVQLEEGLARSPRPKLPDRPRRGLDAVICMEAACEAQDVIANRLDPWHGRHFHPYSFGALEVYEDSPEALVLKVEKLVLGSLRVEVDARFHCPDARTIVMTIIDGEGKGSVVETHASPIAPGRCRIVEATIATSERPGFSLALGLARWIRPFMRRSARRLWVDDRDYAERCYALRQRKNNHCATKATHIQAEHAAATERFDTGAS